MLRNILALLGMISLACVSVVAVNAHAWDWTADDRQPRMRVSFADLNLSTPEGQRTLDRRIRRAISEICGRADPHDLTAQTFERRCRRDARRSTEVQVARAIDTAQQRNLAAVRAPLDRTELAGDVGRVGSAQ